MVGYLRTLSPKHIQRLQQELQAVQQYFLYMPLPGKEGVNVQTASNILVGEMCRRATRLKEERRQSLAVI
jgi:hypothetical protein